MNAEARFKILTRDQLACLWCTGRLGNDQLEVRRLIPKRMRGTEHESNLATACRTCARGMPRGRLAIPMSICAGDVDRLGWATWRQWGDWHLQFLQEEDAVALTFDPGGRDYWIDLSRVHEGDWESHLLRKPWLADRADGFEMRPRKEYFDFIAAISFARTLVTRQAVA